MLHDAELKNIQTTPQPSKRKSYSPFLLSNDFFKEQFEYSFKKITLIQNLYLQNQISNYELVALMLFYYNWITHKNKAVGGPRSININHHFQLSLTLEKACELLDIPLRWQNEKNLSFFEFYLLRSHRQIPESALISLEMWALNQYPLSLLFYTPKVFEVVQMQANGFRCVSVLCDKESLLNKNHAGRDVFSFIIHDLIHADHFFHHFELAQAQIQFASKMLLLFQSEFIQNAIQIDPTFSSEFDYLVSDMNTVPLHLIKSLKSIILRHFKRIHDIEQNKSLPSVIEINFQNTFDQILQLWQLSPEAHKLAIKLNTKDFDNTTEGLILTQQLIHNH